MEIPKSAQHSAPNSISGWLSAYAALVWACVRRQFVYRQNIVSSLTSSLLQLLLQVAIWYALFHSGNSQGASFIETITYFLLGNLVYGFVQSCAGEQIGQDLRSGDIGVRMVKPMSYHAQLFAADQGENTAWLISGYVPVVLFAGFVIGMQPPASGAAVGAALIVLCLGAVLSALINLIISYMSFWLTDYWFLSWFERGLMALLGGRALPMWFMPAWLVGISAYLPFQYAYYQPVALYLGRVPLSDLGRTLAIQLIWIGILYAAERFIWRRAMKKLVVQGG